MTNQIQIYQSQDGQISLQVSLDNETVWLTQAQMAELFDVSVAAVSQHLKNIFDSEELVQNLTVKKFLTVRQEGKRQVNRELEHYNLDAIISADECLPGIAGKCLPRDGRHLPGIPGERGCFPLGSAYSS